MLAIDCSKTEFRPTGIGRWLLNVLRHWPADFPAQLYFRRRIPDCEFLKKNPFSLKIVNCKLKIFDVDPLWRHFALPSVLKRDCTSLLLEPFYVPLLMWPPEKTVLCIADISYKRHPEWFPRRSQLRWFPDGRVKRVRHVITISEFSKGEIIDYYGIPAERITVTPLAADSIFQPPGPDFTAPIPQPYFLFWGDLNTRRRPREMIEAFVKWQQAAGSRQYVFMIIGRDITQPPQDILRRIAGANKALGREAIIHKEYPNNEELVQLVQGALATVYLSDYEGFGMPVLEAMACGVPVITSHTSSLPEVGGEAAYYVKDNTNVDEIRAAMERIAEDAALRKEQSVQGTLQASKFSWETTADETVRILKNLHA